MIFFKSFAYPRRKQRGMRSLMDSFTNTSDEAPKIFPMIFSHRITSLTSVRFTHKNNSRLNLYTKWIANDCL
jgi:hypothetical protein